MAEVIPFKGLTYNTEKTGSLSSQLTLPYDVISPEMREDYYKSSPYNIVRVDFRKGKDARRYSASGTELLKWIAKGALTRDSLPSFYLLEQSFKMNGRLLKRTGFYALVKAEEFSEKSVLPHEETFPKHKQDRLNLLRACRAHTSPIFGVYDGKFDWSEFKKMKPDLEFALRDGGQNVKGKLWKIADEAAVNRIVSFTKRRRIFIADGHHRYETALAYKKENEKKYGRDPKALWNFTLFALVSMQDSGLIVYPTHRAVKFSSPVSAKMLADRLEGKFNVIPCKKEASAENIIFYSGHKFYALVPKSAGVALSIPLKRSAAWKRLSTSVLHHIILKALPPVKNIAYIRNPEEALLAADSGSFDSVFLVPAISPSDIRKTAVKLERMPHKSTYFFPKLPAGVVINKF